MNLDQINKVSKKLPKFMRLLLSGGEPFIRDDLLELCEIFIRNNNIIHLSIPTNGFYTDKIVEFTKKICRKYPKIHLNLSLSLDQIGEGRDRITGFKGSFHQLNHTFIRLDIMEISNLSIGTITTQCKDNENNLYSIYNFAKNVWRVDNFAFNRARGTVVNMDIYRKFTEFLVKKNRSKLPLSWFYEKKCRMVYDAVANEKYPNPCYAGNQRKVISVDGQTYPCETLMFGGKCPCLHECDLATNLFFNLRSWLCRS